MKAEQKAAVREAERYVKRLVEAQKSLGYRRPAAGVVQTAVGDAAQAVQALAALSTQKH